MRVTNLSSIQVKLASPKDILSWSKGEILKPETINYRTLKPEKDGLFCERIFGPTKDFQCYCSKYRGIRYKGITCDRCGVEVTNSSVRRERMGHIDLAAPVSHIWFLRGIPSSIGMVLNISKDKLERVVYFVSYIIAQVDEQGKQGLKLDIEKEYKQKVKNLKAEIKKSKELNKALKDLKESRDLTFSDLEQIQPLRVLSESHYRDFSLRYGEIFEAKTGAEAVYEIFQKIDLKKEVKEIQQALEKILPSARRKVLKRLKFFQGMIDSGVRPEWMFLTVLPVLPPDLRPMVQLDGGRYASSDLNDLYRRVINRNNRLKYLLEISAPEVIVRNEKRMLQEAVDALIDNTKRAGTMTRATTGGRRLLKSLADMLKGKKGRFRRNLLGKRVDYSGRGVIVVGPELKMSNVGLPKEMALEIFKPFVIKKLLDNELAYNVRGASRLIEEQTDEVWAILEEIVQEKLVLLNRAPTLHRISIQAFQPVLIEGKSIRVPPLVCSAFNADFDGDQMAVHLPLSEESQKEAREVMLSSRNLLKPANGRPIAGPSQDMILGCYWLSQTVDGVKGEGRIFSSTEEALLARDIEDIDLRARIKVQSPLKDLGTKKPELIETTIGRIVFNNVLPEDFPYQNYLLDNNKLSKISWNIIEKYGEEKAAIVLDKIKELGFEQSTMSGLSLGMDDFVIPEQKKQIVKDSDKKIEEIEGLYTKGLLSREEKYEKVIEIWSSAKSQVEKLLPIVFEKTNPVFIIADSGCRGSWVQPVQMTGMRGLMASPGGDIIELPVKNSFKEGLGVLEYFISTHGARKGTSDTALGTSKAGYLTRRLVDVSHDAIVTEENCGVRKGITVSMKKARELGQDLEMKINGRIAAQEILNSKGKAIVKSGEMITNDICEIIEKEQVQEMVVRSPLTCNAALGVCQKCYGWDLARSKTVEIGEAIGVVAAQSIGEPGTQLTMRTFHTGGVAGDSDITMGLPRIEEIFEARTPKGEAIISKTDGKVLEVKKGIVRIKPSIKGKKSAKKDSIVYDIPLNLMSWVGPGETVKAGQQLCEGNIDLKKLFRVAGKESVQEYILQEIQRVYSSQGVDIHDKHVESIIRQMFSRVRISKAGDSRFMPGEVVERSEFILENQKLEKGKKQLATAKEILLGISRVALTSDSVLSAASFQQTSKVLIKAALEGKEDRLKGLKENVILGKLIPVGTGYMKKQ